MRTIPGRHDTRRGSPPLPPTTTGPQKISVPACAGRTGVFVARRRAIGRLSVQRSSKDGTAPAAFSGLTFLHTDEEESDWTAASWEDQFGEGLLTSRVVAAMAAESLEAFPGHLIVDSAGGQALIGEAACTRWEQKLNGAALRGVQVHTKMTIPKEKRHSKSHKINDDAHNDRQTSWSFAVHGGRRRQTRLLPLSFHEKQEALINLGTNKLHLTRLKNGGPCTSYSRRTPHDRCDDGTDAGYVPSTWRDLTTLWIDQGPVCDERCVRKRNMILYTVQASQCEMWVWRQTDDAGSTHERRRNFTPSWFLPCFSPRRRRPWKHTLDFKKERSNCNPCPPPSLIFSQLQRHPGIERGTNCH